MTVPAVKLPRRRCPYCKATFQPRKPSHVYCSPRCRNQHHREPDTAHRDERRCAWCGKRIATTVRLDARFCSTPCRKEANKARPCIYCGLPAEGRDHFIPTSFVTTMLSAGIVPKRTKVIVPACRECNSTAGSKVFGTIREKRAYIHDRYRQKYAKLLEAPAWSEEELEELGTFLRGYVRGSGEGRRLLLARLRWPQ